MREDESNWFSKWEDQLPSPDELMPLSQSLITPDLALAFNIPSPNTTLHHAPPPPSHPPLSQPNSSAEFDSPPPGGDEPARTLKRPRLVWTPQLHKRFVDAVAHLGIKNAVPKTIMQLMSVDGLTRENVASHLQKYRLYLKRMQGGGGSASAAADDHLFASSPVPAHFLHPVRGNSEHFGVPFAAGNPIGGLAHHHHQQHPHGHHQIAGHQQQLHQGQFRHFGGSVNGNGNGQFDHHGHNAYMRQTQSMVVQRIGTPVVMPQSYMVEDLETGNGSNGRKVLTLFPTGDD